MANNSYNTSGKRKDVGQFKEYVESDREESRIENLRQYYDQRESERNFHEHGTRSRKEKSYKNTERGDYRNLADRVSYEITELENLLQNLQSSGKHGSIQHQLFEGYLGEVKQLDHRLIELEASESGESANFVELANHLRLYIQLVHEIRELQSSGKQGSAQYLELEHQLHELQAQGRNLGKGNRDKSHRSGGGTTTTGGRTTNYSTYRDNTTAGGTTNYSTYRDNTIAGGTTNYSTYRDNTTGASRRSGNDGRSDVSRLSYEIREVENELRLLADSGKHSTKEQRELERRLSDLQYAISQAEKRSYTTGAETSYRTYFPDDKTGTTRYSRDTDYQTRMSGQTSDRHDTKSYSTKRTSGDHDHREHKSILTKRMEDNNNPDGYSRHTHGHSEHKSHHRRSSTSSDNHRRRSSSGSGSGHHHHHHQHSHCHRHKPEPPPPSIPEEDECCRGPSPPRNATVVDNSYEPPPRKPLLVDNSYEPPPRKPFQVDNSYDPPPRKPFQVDNSYDPPPRKPLLVDRSVQELPPIMFEPQSKPIMCEPPPKPIMCEPPPKPVMCESPPKPIMCEPPPKPIMCEPPPRKPLLVDRSMQEVPPPEKPIVCEPPPKKPLMMDISVQKVPPPTCIHTADKTISAMPIPSCPACYMPPPQSTPKLADSVSCKMVSDKPVGQSSSFLSCFLPTRRESICEIEEPPPPPPPSCPVKPEVVDTAVSAVHFPKQCAPKPPPPVCPKPPPPVCCPKPKPVDPCERVDTETVKSRHMMDAAAGKSYVTMDTGVGVSMPTLAKIKSIYEEIEDDDDYDLFPDREEELAVLAPSECTVEKTSYVVDEGSRRMEESVNPNLCPYCGTGVFVRKTSLAGYLAAVLCFPCGLYCCLTQTCCYIIECTYCHATTERNAEDMKKSYETPHRGTRESLQDVRSIYELEVEETTEDEGGKSYKGRRSSRERIDREREDRDRRERELRDREDRERRERERKEKEKRERDMRNANRNYKEERHDRDIYEKDRTVKDSNRRSIRFSN